MSKQPTYCKRAPDGTFEIAVLGVVGWSVNAEQIINELRTFKPKAVRFIVYSPGGMVFDAIAIVGYLNTNGIESYTEIYGLCASAATVFAAHSGPKNTAIAPGSMFLVHMPYGGDEKAINNATDFLIDLYVKSYGWTKAEARAHMQAENGEGVLWTAAEAKKLGIVSEIMERAAVAARLNLNNTKNKMDNATNAVTVDWTVRDTDNHPQVKNAAGEVIARPDAEAHYKLEEDPTGKPEGTDNARTINLTVSQALAAVTKGLVIDNDMITEAIKPEVEARTKAEKEVTDLTAKLDAMTKERDAAVAAKDAVTTEVTAAQALITKAKEEIAELRKPLGKPPVENNAESAVGKMPGKDEVPEYVKALRKELAKTTPIEVAQAQAKK